MLHSIMKIDPRIQVIPITEEPDVINLVTFVKAKSALCPRCHQKSCSAHSQYTRMIDVLPIQNKAVRIFLRSRKWFCTNAMCASKVFTERYD